MMKIHLITGATGFVGKYLVQSLLENDECVWVIIRPETGASAKIRGTELFNDTLQKWPKTFRFVSGDVLKADLGLDRKILHELQHHEVTLWHLAASLSFLPQDKTNVQRTNLEGTVNTVKFANRYATELMHMSTAYVCGNASTLSENELDVGQKFRNQYEKSKFEAEKYVRSYTQIPFMIFRPSIIIGDAYKGKAEGCTFGYYRYMFVFHFLKQQVIKLLKRPGVLSRFLRTLGASYDTKQDMLTVPYLLIPYPFKARVDLVTVDYVIDSMLQLHRDAPRNITVHITQRNPPDFRFLFEAALEDLGYRKVKLVPVPIWFLPHILRFAHFVGVPVRKYIRSIMWYTPYFSKARQFEHSVARKHMPSPPTISRTLIGKINRYAKEEILDSISV